MKSSAFLTVIAAFLFCAVSPAQAEDRIALVIGNNQYPADGLFPTLKNCVSDATLVADTLDKMGFHVLRAFNATRSQMDDQRAEFEAALRPGCTAVFYFAGHGIEYEKTDYLMAANAKLKARSLLGEESMDAETFARAMVGGGARSSFLFLDCCRESPPAEWVTRGVRKRGLAKLDIQGDLIVAYAATPGQAALDGDENAKNSPYAAALAHWLPMGLAHPQMFQEVRREVFRTTKGEQRTYEEGSFLVDYVFPKLGVPAMSTTPVKPVAKPFPLPRDAVAAATKDTPFVNSLGMKFVPVAGTKALFSVWDTRVQDYAAFAQESGREWPKPSFAQEPTHPAVSVSWEDAQAFCAWLSKKEGREYRLPTDTEWSAAVGSQKYPWGNAWPPPKGAGNYSSSLGVDSFANTSPVGSFPANYYGLYDMGGNVWQWCEDEYKASMNDAETLKEYSFMKEEKASDGTPYRVLRGGSWRIYGPLYLRSAYRDYARPTSRYDYGGFRCVLVVSGG